MPPAPFGSHSPTLTPLSARHGEKKKDQKEGREVIVTSLCILRWGGGAIQYLQKHDLNRILHTAWLESHALTLKNNTAKYYFGEKSSFLHTFLKFSSESRTIQVNFKNILLSMLSVFLKK